MSAKDGGPAFPTVSEHQTGPNTYQFEGMTLRDYFAAKVIQAGLTASPSSPRGITREEHIKDMCSVAYEVADAMLAEREKETK